MNVILMWNSISKSSCIKINAVLNINVHQLVQKKGSILQRKRSRGLKILDVNQKC